MDIEIRHARVVAAIAEAGSISKAAALLGLSQPSLTAQLHRIEKAMGGTLFSRSPGGVMPTSLGRKLIPMLVELVQRRDAVVAEASNLSESRPTLRIGNFEWTPSTLCAAIQTALETFEVTTETVDATTAVDKVRQGVLAAALTMNHSGSAPAPAGGLLGSALVVREPVWLALPVGHPLAAEKVVSLAQMSSLTWVRHAQSHWFHDVESQLFARFGEAQPEVLHHVAAHAEAMSWVQDAGAASMITPTGATRDVQLVPVTGMEHAELRLVWRADEIHELSLRRMMRAIRRYYCEYARTFPRYWQWIGAHRDEYTELEEFLPRGESPAPSGAATGQESR